MLELEGSRGAYRDRNCSLCVLPLKSVDNCAIPSVCALPSLYVLYDAGDERKG